MAEPVLSVFDPDKEFKRKEAVKKIEAEDDKFEKRIELLEELKKESVMKGRCCLCTQVIERRADRTEIWRVVMVYKLATGYAKDDKQWDNTFRSIYAPVANKLINFMGSWQLAADCVQETVEKIRNWNPGATISLQKILQNHASEWKKNMQEREPRKT